LHAIDRREYRRRSMNRPALAACIAAGAVLVLVPAAGPAVIGGSHPGSSCVHPHTWHLTRAQVRDVMSQGGTDVTNGRVTFFVELVDSGGEPLLEVTAARGWRVCALRGISFDRSAWELPGTVGRANERSRVLRWFPHGHPKDPRLLTVTYAPRRSADGSTCADPRISFVDDGPHDGGASIRTDVEHSDRGYRTVASWHVGESSRFCYVKGWMTRGTPFTVRDSAVSSYPMQPFGEPHVTHDNPVAYLLIAFAR
jgi:hypothetical protein